LNRSIIVDNNFCKGSANRRNNQIYSGFSDTAHLNHASFRFAQTTHESIPARKILIKFVFLLTYLYLCRVFPKKQESDSEKDEKRITTNGDIPGYDG
jgi:hypothetical protein